MKILILGFTKLAYMPYANFYLDQLQQTNCEIHLLYWNRDHHEDITVDPRIILHDVAAYQKDEVAKWKKMKNFLIYRHQALALLRHHFDFVIVMHTLPAVLVYDVLIRKYHKKFILDYRDVTFENNRIFRYLIHRLVFGSSATFVSSDAFRKYLPKTDHIYTTHNILMDSLNHRNIRSAKDRNVQPIRIRYWGYIRHENINRKIIDQLANDPRFELHYHGREQQTAANLKQYCHSRQIANIFFHGEYVPAERYDFAQDTELLHNIYENDVTKDAMGNKYYDGVTFGIPQLCSLGSFMGELVSANRTGLAYDLDQKHFADDIWAYYKAMNWPAFEQNCDQALKLVLSQYHAAAASLDKIILSLEDHQP